MNVVTSASEASGKASIPTHRGAPAWPRILNHLSSTSRGAADLLLVFGTMAMVLGLAAVTAGLTPFPAGMPDAGQNQPRIGLGRDIALAVWPRIAGHDLVRPLVSPMVLAGEPAPVPLPRINATGPWFSPLYPQNGVTLWDRIRVSSSRDRHSFLLGAAIQIHAPETAATPGPRQGFPSCCPRT